MRFKSKVHNFTVKGAIFDVDDTLLNDRPDGQNSVHQHSRMLAARFVGKKHKLPVLSNITTEQAEQSFSTSTEHTPAGVMWRTLEIIKIVDTKKIDTQNIVLKDLLKYKIYYYEKLLTENNYSFENSIEFIDYIYNNGLENKLSIASNAQKNDIKTFLAGSGFNKYFKENTIVSKDDIYNAKPHPEAFDLAFKTLKLNDIDRKYVCAFEDHPRGIESAKAAGLFTLGFAIRHTKKEFLSLKIPPDFVYSNYKELFNYFVK